MSNYEIEYCPWCSGDIERHQERSGHDIHMAKKCTECDKVFRVSVPKRETKLRWKSP